MLEEYEVFELEWQAKAFVRVDILIWCNMQIQISQNIFNVISQVFYYIELYYRGGIFKYRYYGISALM